jgi:hypothetical protein
VVEMTISEIPASQPIFSQFQGFQKGDFFRLRLRP